MSPLRRNLAAIAARWPAVAEELEATEPAGDAEVVSSRTGAPSARYGGQLLHSLFDPVREAERLVRSSCGPDATAAVVLGFGLGYACEACLRRTPELPVLAVEPDPGLFVRALAARPLEALLASPRLRLHVSADPQGLAAAVESAGDELNLARPCVLRLPASAARHPAYFDRVERILVAARDRGRVNVETLQRFGPLWVRNLLGNLQPFLSSPGVGALTGAFEGVPALVLASGPSLDGVLPRIRELALRCVVISVDTSLRACLAAGLQPDFVVVIDPQYWNSRHLDGTDSPRTLLVAESATHPRALRLAPRGAFFMSSLFPLGRFVESFGAHKGDLGTGGSVATTAWDLARTAGAAPIVMAGLDLGYPGRATHFRGAFFEHRFLAVADRTEPAEQHAFGYLTGADPFPVRSSSGGTVLTDRRMALYAAWFERQARQFPGVRTRHVVRRGRGHPGHRADDDRRGALDGAPQGRYRRADGGAAGGHQAGRAAATCMAGAEGRPRPPHRRSRRHARGRGLGGRCRRAGGHAAAWRRREPGGDGPPRPQHAGPRRARCGELSHAADHRLGDARSGGLGPPRPDAGDLPADRQVGGPPRAARQAGSRPPACGNPKGALRGCRPIDQGPGR